MYTHWDGIITTTVGRNDGDSYDRIDKYVSENLWRPQDSLGID